MMRLARQTEWSTGRSQECEAGTLGRRQKMEGSEKDIVLYYGGDGEPLKGAKKKRNIEVTWWKAQVWKIY